MPITIKAHVLDPKRFAGKVTQVLQEEAAPLVGLYLVRQIEFTHDVQGRDEDDRTGIWPPRKMPSSGLIVFGERRSVLAALKQLADKDKKEFTIIRDAKGLGADRSATFSRRQVEGARLAIEAEKRRKRFKKRAAGLAGISGERKQQEAKRSLKMQAVLALSEGRFQEADRKLRQLDLMAANISKGRSYKRSVNYLPRPVLLRTGAMKSSWTFRVERENDLVVIMVGTKIPYAKHHELGEGVPQRRQVVVANQDRAKIADMVAGVLNRDVLR